MKWHPTGSLKRDRRIRQRHFIQRQLIHRLIQQLPFTSDPVHSRACFGDRNNNRSQHKQRKRSQNQARIRGAKARRRNSCCSPGARHRRSTFRAPTRARSQIVSARAALAAAAPCPMPTKPVRAAQWKDREREQNGPVRDNGGAKVPGPRWNDPLGKVEPESLPFFVGRVKEQWRHFIARNGRPLDMQSLLQAEWNIAEEKQYPLLISGDPVKNARARVNRDCVRVMTTAAPHRDDRREQKHK